MQVPAVAGNSTELRITRNHLVESIDMCVTPELLESAESVHDGWFAEHARIDWEEFVDRLEAYAGVDLGSSMVSPQIRAIQHHIRKYRKM